MSGATTQRSAALAALFAAGLVLVGGVDFHRSEAPHGALGEATTIAVGARHAADEAHLETAAETTVGHCSACLQRHRTVALSRVRPVRAWRSAPETLSRSPEASWPLSGAVRLAPSRAPPAPVR